MYTSYVSTKFNGRTGYQIFVDRFCHVGPPLEKMQGRVQKEWNDTTPNWKPDEDGIYRNQYFYGGNLQGIMSKLPYLESLGVSLLYLSPISYTESSHHYDVEDQRVIDPWIGTWQDFIQLCKKAHDKGMLVCVDLVFNHMGSRSKMFQEAMQDKDSMYHDWFEWDEQGNPIYWYGFKNMPQCNKLNSGYQEYALSVCKFYVDMGVDGIRLDLGEVLPQEFVQKIKAHIKKINPETLIVNERWEFGTCNDKPKIYFDQADSLMNYPLADGIIRWIRYGNERHFWYTYERLEEYPTPVKNVLWNFLDSHDIPRASNMLAGSRMNENPFNGRVWEIERTWGTAFDTFAFRRWEAENDSSFDQEIAQRRVVLASLLQFFEPGNPIIYYGTEIGMTGYKDPFNRKPYPWGQTSSLLDFYKELGAFRRENRDILSDGKVRERYITPSVLLISRETEAGELTLVMNRTEQRQENPIKGYDMKNSIVVVKVGEGQKEILMPYSAIVYRTSK